MYKPLKNIRVLDFSRLLPGPFCSYLLSEMGASVSVVEAPHLEKFLDFPNIEKNKKFICLDLKNKKHFEKIEKLIRTSDILLEGFRPGVMKRLGLSFSQVKKINSKIIYCSISGYGQKKGSRAGHDLNFLAESGFLNFLAAGSSPKVPGIPLGDLIAGQEAAFQITAALNQVKVQKKAIYLDLSIYKSAQKFLYPFRGVEKKVAPLFSSQLARYQVYQTADQKFLAVAALEDKFWKKLVEQLKIPSSILQGSESEVTQFLKHKFSLKPLSVWLKELSHPDFCVSEIC